MDELAARGIPTPFLPAVGGLFTGVVAIGFPEVLYQGFGNVNAILESRGSDYGPVLLLQIIVAKILTTGVCRASGLVGGLYAPSIFIGIPPHHIHMWPVVQYTSSVVGNA